MPVVPSCAAGAARFGSSSCPRPFRIRETGLRDARRRPPPGGRRSPGRSWSACYCSGMLTTVEGVYENGRVELAERPAGVERAKVYVTFVKEAEERAGA